MLKFILALILLLPTPPSTISTRGSLVIAGGNISNVSIYNEFIKLAGERAKIAVITTASPSNKEDNLSRWANLYKGTVVCVTDKDPFPDDVVAVWIAGGDQGFLERAYIGKPFAQKLLDFYNRGGIIGGSSAGSAFMSKIMIRSSVDNDPEMGIGLDLLPHAIIDQHFSARNRLPRLEKAVAYHPGIYGFGIDENTAIIYNGETIRVLGENEVTILHCGTVKKLKGGEELLYGHP